MRSLRGPWGRRALQDADARLRALVDQVWLHPLDRDSPVAVTLSRPPPDHVVAEEYAVLPHPSMARILVPLPSRRVAAASLLRYNAVRAPTSRALRGAVGWAYAVGIGRYGFPHRLVVSVDQRFPPSRWAEVLVLRHLAAELDRPGLMARVDVRRINPNAKPTLQLFLPDGSPAGFAKLGINAATRSMVRNEAAATAMLHGRVHSVLVPRLLASGEWRDTAYTVGAPLPRDLRRCTSTPGDTLAQIAEVAGSGTDDRRPFATSTHAARLRAELSAAAPHDDVARVLGAWLERLTRHHQELAFGRMHGDWIPNNLGWSGDRLAAWDWEHSADDVPVGLDLLHWYFQRGLDAQGLPAAVRAVDAATQQLGDLGVPDDARALVASLYLLDLFVRRMKLANGGGGWNARWYPDLLEVAARRDLVTTPG